LRSPKRGSANGIEHFTTKVSSGGPPGSGRQDYWDSAYAGRHDQVSWYQADPLRSVRLITEQAAALPRGRGSAVVDAGGGASVLAERLAATGFTDVTVVDISAAALTPPGRGPAGVTRIRADLLDWRPARRYQIWHDRAVFHFLTSPGDRAAYLATLRAALGDGGAIIMGVFAPDGPARCSGLPVARYGRAALAAELSAAYGDDVTVTGGGTEDHRTPAGAVQPFTWLTARLR
jgi:SAM-dependent methyltransferase